MIRRLLFVLAFLLLGATVHAQTHYCDTTPQTSATKGAGESWTWFICFSNKDANGNPALPTGWAVYDNGTRSTQAFTPGTTSSVSGLQVYTWTTTVPTTVGAHTVQVAAITSGGEGAKSNPFAWTITPPITVAAAAVKLSGQ